MLGQDSSKDDDNEEDEDDDCVLQATTRTTMTQTIQKQQQQQQQQQQAKQKYNTTIQHDWNKKGTFFHCLGVLHGIWVSASRNCNRIVQFSLEFILLLLH